MSAKPKYYLDTNIFLRWLNGEDVKGYSTDAGLIQLILNNEVACVTSSLTKLEILECHTDEQSWIVWQRFQSRRNVTIMAPNTRITDLGMKIRNYYAELRKAGGDALRPPCVPDSIHIATAIYTECDVMYSRDRGKKDSKQISPLGISGNVMGRYDLEIIKPIGFSLAMSHT